MDSEGILCTWLLCMAAWWLAVLMARYLRPWGGCKKTSWAGKGDKCQRQQWWRRFSKQARCRCTNNTASYTADMPHIGTCGWISPLKLNAERGEASKNVVTPEEMVFSA